MNKVTALKSTVTARPAFAHTLLWLSYLVVACLIVLPVATNDKLGMSQIDEPSHLDWAYRASKLEAPAAGDSLSPVVLDFWSCIGQQNVPLPPCGVGATADSYPNRGENFNFRHPPGYYLTTGLVAKAIAADPDSADFAHSARAINVLWLTAGLGMGFYALRKWKVPVGIAYWVPLLPVTTPMVLHALTTVNPDGAALVSGWATVWLAGRVLREERGGWLVPLLITTAITSTKIMQSLPIVGLVLALLILAIQRGISRATRVRYLVTVAGAAVGALAVYLSWTLIQNNRGVADWQNPLLGQNTRPVTGLPVNEWMGTLFMGHNIVTPYWLPNDLNSPVIDAWADIATFGVIAIIFAAIASFKRFSPQWALAIATLASIAVYPFAVQLFTYLGDGDPHWYFPYITPRYAIAVLPMVAALFALLVAKYKMRWVPALVALLGFGALAYTVLLSQFPALSI